MASSPKYEVISIFSSLGYGGVNQVIMNLRSPLRERSVNLTWLACGAVPEAPGWLDEPEHMECGEFLASSLTNGRERAEVLINRIIERRPFAVLFHILCGQVETNLAAYLPTDIFRIAMVHSITPGTYRAARAMRDFLHAAIGVSPRISEDLVRICGFPADAVFCAPNGLDCRVFLAAERSPNENGPLRVLSSGRIEDSSKGVFWVPEIVAKARAAGQEITLTVVGRGPDRAELERRIRLLGLMPCTCLRDWVRAEEMPRLYAEHDVFLFPSRYEGLGLALVEAMAGGCVPVATRLRGVTDYVVRDGCTGYLFPSADVACAARLLARLARDRKELSAMSKAGREEHLKKFDIGEQASRIQNALELMENTPRHVEGQKRHDEWRIMRGLQPAWWAGLPEPVKNCLRVIRERVGIV